jgi:hypothetical protein
VRVAPTPARRWSPELVAWRRGHCLLALGRPEGQIRLREARVVVAALNTEPLLAEADATLSDTTTLRYNRRR